MIGIEIVGGARWVCPLGYAHEPAARLDKKGEASLTSALTGYSCGCFVPDLTRFTAPPCEGARQIEL
jgi:hypothetical protein